jgi:cytochrome c oxidase subunit 3
VAAEQKAGLRPLALRTHPLVFATVMFLASELMFFAGLFAAYYDLRTMSPVWPPAGTRLDLFGSSIGTLMLGISSVTMVFVTHFLAKNRIGLAKLWLAITALLGIAFLGIALNGWSKTNIRIDANAYGSLYFAMTGFHALHVLAGIILLGALLVGMQRRAFAGDHRAGAEAITYYWHFVFIVWVGLWATIYLVR